MSRILLHMLNSFSVNNAYLVLSVLIISASDYRLNSATVLMSVLPEDGRICTDKCKLCILYTLKLPSYLLEECLEPLKIYVHLSKPCISKYYKKNTRY